MNANNRRVMYALSSLHIACPPDNAVPPALARRDNAQVVGKASSSIKRCYLMREMKRRELVAAAEKGLYERRTAQLYYGITNDIFELEVWMQFPELSGRPIAIYSDWSIGPEVHDTGTNDMFEPVATPQPGMKAREVASTRSDDIRPNGGHSFTLDPLAGR